jgi:hypothetical protein
LDNSLVGDKFNVAPVNQASKERKGATDIAVNLRWGTGEGSELLGIQECLVDALATRVKIDHLMQGRPPTFRTGCCGCGCGLLSLVLSVRVLYA